MALGWHKTIVQLPDVGIDRLDDLPIDVSRRRELEGVSAPAATTRSGLIDPGTPQIILSQSVTA